jgi:hypothetical protein
MHNTCALLALTSLLCGGVSAAEPRPDLDLEARLQFDDLQQQIADWPKVLKIMAERKHDLAAQTYRADALITPEDRDPVDVVARRTAAVLGEIKRLGPKADLAAAEKRLGELRARVGTVDPADKEARQALFAEICRVRREIVLANPLLDFSDIVFCTRGTAPAHCVDQYFGWANEPGGGLYRLKNAFGSEPELCDLLAEATVAEGRLKGQRLKGGAFLSPALSFDAKTVAFAYAERNRNPKAAGRWAAEQSFHLFRIHLDGTGLAQLTDGPWNDFDPCFLPAGRIAFISERRGGFGRCHGRPVPTYTLHSINADGSNIVCLSYHETNEWNPSVAHDGTIVYSRWDYVDRGPEITHHPWVTSPDGCDARALHGNYPRHTHHRPYMEAHVRAIPGSPRYLSAAVAHHGESIGSLVLLDFQIPDDDGMSQVKRITPEMIFPEAEGNSTGGSFATAWPLSEDFYLACYAPRGTVPDAMGKPQQVPMGLYLVDSFGNRELIWRDAKFRAWDPIPLKARPRPPVIPHKWDIDAAAKHQKPGGSATGGEGTVALMNVYESHLPWPKDRKIATLRVVQLFPKSTPVHDTPNVGYSAQLLARGSLGTVPVEDDGSAHFVMPAGKAVYFQALDENGLAVQSMMSAAYVHPGERLVCQGCHEPRPIAPRQPKELPVALRRSPSRLKPEPEGSWPLSFPRLVQPVLSAKCVGCHEESRQKDPKTKAPDMTGTLLNRPDWLRIGWTESYNNLARVAWSPGGKRRQPDGTRSQPGGVGAVQSRLFEMLKKGHHDVKLTSEELRRITVWLDCGSPFYGAYERIEEQAQGKLVLPAVE